MKTVFLHIGLHKTGTSSIQKFLLKNRSVLLDNGVEYLIPDPWPIPFQSEPVIDVVTKGFEGINSSRAEKVIISHENYSWIFEEEKVLLIVQEILKHADELKIVLYLRRQDSLAISQKQEGTKWIDNSVAYGHDLCALPQSLNYYSSNYLNFYKKVKLWSDAVGKSNVIVRVFDKEKLLNGDVVDDFCDLVGLYGIKNLEKVGRVNESISRKRQLFLHMTRKYFNEHSPEKHRLVERVLKLDISDKEKLLPSRQEAESFYTSFLESNNALKNEFLDEFEGALFSEDFSMYPLYSNEGFSNIEKEDFYIKLLQELLSEINLLQQMNDKDKMADWFRDRALEAEKTNIKLALKLMIRAKSLRPSGHFINKKIEHYSKLLTSE